jgi:hypothetical protein
MAVPRNASAPRFPGSALTGSGFFLRQSTGDTPGAAALPFGAVFVPPVLALLVVDLRGPAEDLAAALQQLDQGIDRAGAI